MGTGHFPPGEEEGEEQRGGAGCAPDARWTDSLRVALSHSPQPIPVKDATGSVGCRRSHSSHKII